MDKPVIKDKKALEYIEYLEKKLEIYVNSPYVKTYLTLHNQIDSFNEQLTLRKEIVDGAPVEKGMIDLFADKEDKSFDRTKWYFEKILDLNKNLESLRKLMSPEEVEEVKKVTKEGGVEQFLNQGNAKS